MATTKFKGYAAKSLKTGEVQKFEDQKQLDLHLQLHKRKFIQVDDADENTPPEAEQTVIQEQKPISQRSKNIAAESNPA